MENDKVQNWITQKKQPFLAIDLTVKRAYHADDMPFFFWKKNYFIDTEYKSVLVLISLAPRVSLVCLVLSSNRFCRIV